MFIDQQAGYVGVNPDSLSFGQLLDMVDGKLHRDGEQIGHTCAYIYNTALGTRGRKNASHCNPYIQNHGHRLTPDNLDMLAGWGSN